MQKSVFLILFLFNLISASDPDPRITLVIDSIMHTPKRLIAERRQILVDLSVAVNQSVLDSALDRLEGSEAKESYLRAKISSSWLRIKREAPRWDVLNRFAPTRESTLEFRAWCDLPWQIKRDALGSTEIMPTVDRVLGDSRLKMSTRLDKLNYLAGLIHKREWLSNLFYQYADDTPMEARVEDLKGVISSNWADVDESKRLDILFRFGESASKSRSRKRRALEE